jgi:hypothetical protein
LQTAFRVVAVADVEVNVVLIIVAVVVLTVVTEVGVAVGDRVGIILGCAVGDEVGASLGEEVGVAVGDRVGIILGCAGVVLLHSAVRLCHTSTPVWALAEPAAELTSFVIAEVQAGAIALNVALDCGCRCFGW